MLKIEIITSLIEPRIKNIVYHNNEHLNNIRHLNLNSLSSKEKILIVEAKFLINGNYSITPKN